MRILEVVDLVPKKFGGFEKYSCGFSDFLRRKGHEHIVVFNGKPCTEFERELLKVGAEYHDQCFHDLGLRDALKLLKFARSCQADVVHLHFYPTPYL